MSYRPIYYDTETTGLSPAKDKIIEIAAYDPIRNKSFSELINPEILISEESILICNITNEMVKNAPALQDILQELELLISDLPILGQNISFDLSFFKKYKVLQSNQSLDTYEMASVLLPNASRYNLSALTHELKIPQSGFYTLRINNDSVWRQQYTITIKVI